MKTPRTILIVDDEPLLRQLAADSLGDAGFDVVEAETAEHAIKILMARDDVSVVFTDVNMPGHLDGMDLAALVAAHWPRIRIVVTSGRNLPETPQLAGQFVPKPYDLTRLAELIANTSTQDTASTGEEPAAS